ncbi:MAG: hypothetical protein U9Q90_00285 [Campylobacterota bacterium]|nr:hypothetical protein [Campylobacterota bacterium]
MSRRINKHRDPGIPQRKNITGQPTGEQAVPGQWRDDKCHPAEPSRQNFNALVCIR